MMLYYKIITYFLDVYEIKMIEMRHHQAGEEGSVKDELVALGWPPRIVTGSVNADVTSSDQSTLTLVTPEDSI